MRKLICATLVGFSACGGSAPVVCSTTLPASVVSGCGDTVAAMTTIKRGAQLTLEVYLPRRRRLRRWRI